MVIGHVAAEFGPPLNFFITYYPKRDLTLRVFLEVFALQKISIFVNFDLDLHFQGHLLQELDG